MTLRNARCNDKEKEDMLVSTHATEHEWLIPHVFECSNCRAYTMLNEQDYFC